MFVFFSSTQTISRKSIFCLNTQRGEVPVLLSRGAEEKGEGKMKRISSIKYYVVFFSKGHILYKLRIKPFFQGVLLQTERLFKCVQKTGPHNMKPIRASGRLVGGTTCRTLTYTCCATGHRSYHGSPHDAWLHLYKPVNPFSLS